jgi:hypothetical protein
VDPLFHPDSHGYRPGKSAWDAVGPARQRCWRYDWILDLDIKGFFDNFLGFLFRPAMIRSWNLHLRSDKAIEDLSRMFNPVIRGWLQYYGRFYRSALYPPNATTGSIVGPLG